MFELVSPQRPRFVVRLLPCDEGVTVRATGPDGQSAEVHTHLQRVEDVLRMASQPNFHEDIGRGLFRALFFGAMEDLYRAAYTRAVLDGVPLTLELHLAHDVLRLGRYPWELLHDGTRFIVQSGTVNLVRTLDFPDAIPLYEPRGPLEILVAAALTSDHPPLTSVYDELVDALNARLRADDLDLAALFPPTWETLLDWLLGGAPDVLHFEGRGDFTRTGRLIFAGGRSGDPVDAAVLGAAFFSTRLRLVALSASAEQTNGDESLLGSIAPTLIEAGVPGVVAVQRTLPHTIAAQFWTAFYAALLNGDNIENALATARGALHLTPYWHAIALYRRTVPALRTGGDPVPVRLDSAAPDQATVGWTVRAALWIQAHGADLPAPQIVTRLIGVEPPPDDNDLTLRTRSDGAHAVSLRAGTFTVRLNAPGCAVHHTGHHTRLFHPDTDAPPLWFAVTPRQPGDVTLTFELLQNDRVLATVDHPLRVIAETGQGDAGEGVAVVYTHSASQEIERAPAPVTAAEELIAFDAAPDTVTDALPDTVPSDLTDPNTARPTAAEFPALHTAAPPRERGWTLPPSAAERALFAPPSEPALSGDLSADITPHAQPDAAPDRTPLIMLILLVVVIVAVVIVLALITA